MYPYRLYMVIDLEDPKHYYPRKVPPKVLCLCYPLKSLWMVPFYGGQQSPTSRIRQQLQRMRWMAKMAATLREFELNGWRHCPLKKARDSNMWPVKICNLLRNLHYLHSPEIGRVIYIIIYIAGVLYATLLRTATANGPPIFFFECAIIPTT